MTAREPVVIRVDADRPIREQIDTPENRAAVEDIVRRAMPDPSPEAPGSLWGEPESAQVPPIAFTTERKGLLAAFSRTQHALASEDDERPILQAWWLAVADRRLSVHAADNHRVARGTVDVLPAPEDAAGTFGIHRTDGKALLAFLAKGPDDVWVEAAGGAWTIRHEDGVLRGRLMNGTPPGWDKVTEEREPVIVVGMAARYVSEAGKAAEGRSGVVRVEWLGDGAPIVFRSTDLDEWVMPVRLGPDAV